MPDVMPILPSWDFDETSNFYHRLGFEEAGRWPGNYLILEHPDGIELHFFATAHTNPKRNDHGTYIRYPTSGDIDALYESWRAVELVEGRLHRPTDMDYGLREFALVDPMGNLLRVGGMLGI